MDVRAIAFERESQEGSAIVWSNHALKPGIALARYRKMMGSLGRSHFKRVCERP